MSACRLDLTPGWRFLPDVFATGLQEGRHRPAFKDADWLKVSADRPWDTYANEFRTYDGIGWFRKEIRIGSKPKITRLNFEGAGYATRVWVNGREAGSHDGPYTPFSFRIERLLRRGRNTIAVRVHNTYDQTTIPIRRTDWLKYGGITRPVALTMADAAAFHRATVTIAGPDDVPVLTARGTVEGAGPLRVIVRVLDRGAVRITASGPVRGGSFSIPLAAGDLPRWTPDSPRLVSVELILCGVADRILDRKVIRTGIRTLRWDGGTLRLNGRRLWLRGVNQVEEYPDWTGSPTAAQTRARVRDLKRNLHANFIRCAHYPHHPRFLDACDELGLLVLSEIPMCYLPAGEDTLVRGAALAESMQWRDAHRPSVILWSAGNERPSHDPATAKEITNLIGRLQAFDPGRPATCVSHHGASDPTLGACDVICMNDYTGVWGKPFADTTARMPAVARAISRNLDAIHRHHPAKPVIMSEFGGPVFPVPGNRFGSLSWQAAQVATAIRVYRSKPYVSGCAAWCYRDQRINGASHYPAGALGTNVLEVFGLSTLTGRPRPSLRAVARLYRRLAVR